MHKLDEIAKGICENCRKRLNSYKAECPFIEHWNRYCGVVETIDHEMKVLKRFQDSLIYDKVREME